MTKRGSFKDADVFIPWFDAYDRSVVFWILNNIKRGGKAVPAVFATPERAFGQMAKVLSNKYGTTYDAKSVPLPFLSIQRLADTLQYEARWHKGAIRKMQAINSKGKYSAAPGEIPADADQIDSWLGMEFPHPIQLNYQVEAWARIGRDLDLIRYRLLMAFKGLGGMLYTEVEHPPPFGVQQRPITLRRFQNTSQYEVKEGEDRKLRETFDLAVEAWIPFPAEATKAVKAAVVDIEEEDTGTLMDRVTMFDER